MATSLPMIFTRGSHYEVFKQVGETFKDRIKLYLERIGPSLTNYKEFAESQHGKPFVDNLRTSGQEYYPEYMDELRGMADGAGVSFDTLLIANLELEIMWEMGRKREEMKESCTDVLLNNGKELLQAHNEDLSAEMEDLCFMLCATFDSYIDHQGEHQPSESLCAFMAPGILPGICFNFNGHGFAYSVNTIFVPHFKLPDKLIPEILLQRSLAAAKDIEDAERRVHKHPGVIVIANNINVGQLGVSDKLWSLELGPDPQTGQNGTHVMEMTADQQVYAHFNGFQHSSLPFSKGEGSERRKETFTEISPPKSKQDVLAFLADRSDTDYPILRSAKPPDKGITAFTALFNYKERSLSVYQLKVSKDKPVAVIPMDILCQDK